MVVAVAAVVIVVAVAGMAKGGFGGIGGGHGGGHGGGGGSHGGGGGGGGGHGGGGGRFSAHPSWHWDRVHGGGGGAVVPSVREDVVVSPNVDVRPVVDVNAHADPNVAIISTPTPWFTGYAQRRAFVAISAGVDGGTCLYQPSSCSTSAVRAGLRLVDYAELTGGVRSFWGWGLADGVARFAPMGGLAFHGSFPRFKQLAFYLGFEAGGGNDAIPFFLAARAGLRLSPIPELTIGIFPLSPIYVSNNRPNRPSGAQAPTSLEVSTAF